MSIPFNAFMLLPPIWWPILFSIGCTFLCILFVTLIFYLMTNALLPVYYATVCSARVRIITLLWRLIRLIKLFVSMPYVRTYVHFYPCVANVVTKLLVPRTQNTYIIHEISSWFQPFAIYWPNSLNSTKHDNSNFDHLCHTLCWLDYAPVAISVQSKRNAFPWPGV